MAQKLDIARYAEEVTHHLLQALDKNAKSPYRHGIVKEAIVKAMIVAADAANNGWLLPEAE